jgi:hypothetical protein
VHQARFTNHYYLANHSRLGDGELPPDVEGPGDARRAVAAQDAAGADALGDAAVGDRLHSGSDPGTGAETARALQQPHDAGAELAPAVAASTSATPAAWLATASCISALAASSPRGSTPLFQGRTERETH